jgi:hypothetical protein
MTERFLWGTATSAYQIEGAAENDWTAWEAAGRLKVPGVRCGRGAGHRERWRSDLALLPTLGANAYRFSIEWSRIEPQPGEFDEEALALEVERVEALRALGIEPVVTLLHYTRSDRERCALSDPRGESVGGSGSEGPRLGDLERADRPPARRFPGRRDPSRTPELRGGGGGAGEPAAGPRGSGARGARKLTRGADRDRSQHAALRPRPPGKLAGPASGPCGRAAL